VASLDRSVNLESMAFDADGAGVRGAATPLTRGSHRVAFFGASPDGRSVVLQDDLGSESRLWRVDAGGRWSAPSAAISHSSRWSGALRERRE
jgi:hypothetical protein